MVLQENNTKGSCVLQRDIPALFNDKTKYKQIICTHIYAQFRGKK